MEDTLKGLFAGYAGVHPQSVQKLTGDGSNRAYYRMTADGVSLIGAVGTSVEENRAFVAIARALEECGVDAPRVVAVSDDGLCYLQTDLGDASLFMYMKEGREAGCFLPHEREALCRVMSLLPDIQYGVARNLDFDVCYPVAAFDRRTVMWDISTIPRCRRSAGPFPPLG